MPDEQSEIDTALAQLAQACCNDLTRSAYERAWDAALPQVRPETVGTSAASPIEEKRAEVSYLYQQTAVTRFARALAEMEPPPERSVRDAVIALHNAMNIDIAKWQNLGEAEQQALINDRDVFISGTDMEEFYQKAWPRMCCIVGATTRVENGVEKTVEIGGTGFLVGPNLVMTNSHVVAALLDGAAQRPGTDKDFALFFDHYEKQKIVLHTADIPGTLRVQPASDWLLVHSPENKPGGDADALLDYAVVKLKDRTGDAAANRRHGARRGWMKVPLPGEGVLGADNRVAIPQHPGGLGLCLDIGRVEGSRPGVVSRVLYRVNTAPGSSGSPVLATGGRLVALHEGSRPRGEGRRDDVTLNQGIRVTAFTGALLSALTGPDRPLPNLEERWCVRGTGSPRRPLIGRRRFIDWVRASRSGENTTTFRRVPPVCAVHGPVKSGKSFTADIIGALVESTGDDLVVFRMSTSEDPATSLRTYVLPDRPDQLLLALADAIGLPTENLPKAPPEFDRAETELGFGDVDDRKLNAWASEDLPNWFATELGRVLGKKPGALLWTVFDIAPNAPFGPLIRDFLAKWIAPVDKSHPFAQCRWVFIDYKPDFSVDITDDPLDPVVDLTKEDLRRFLDSAYDAMGGDQPVEMLMLITQTLDAVRTYEPKSLWPILTGLCEGLVEGLLIRSGVG
jgi:hypothetical protein